MKEYLSLGYILNEKLLQEQVQQLKNLKRTVGILNNVVESTSLTSEEATGLLKVLSDYTYALDVLDKYDHRTLTIEATHQQSLFTATYDQAMSAIHSLKVKFGAASCLATKKMNHLKAPLQRSTNLLMDRTFIPA